MQALTPPDGGFGARAPFDDPRGPSRLVSFAGRWLLLFALAIALGGTDAGNLLVGALAAAYAAHVSGSLLPPSARGIAPLALARFAGHFLVQMVRAGVDVALRALHPALPVRPGFVQCETGLASGMLVDGFRAVESLQPGTLPVGPEEGGLLLVHCLDCDAPVEREVARDAVLFEAAFAPSRSSEPA